MDRTVVHDPIGVRGAGTFVGIVSALRASLPATNGISGEAILRKVWCRECGLNLPTAQEMTPVNHRVNGRACPGAALPGKSTSRLAHRPSAVHENVPHFTLDPMAQPRQKQAVGVAMAFVLATLVSFSVARALWTDLWHWPLIDPPSATRSEPTPATTPTPAETTNAEATADPSDSGESEEQEKADEAEGEEATGTLTIGDQLTVISAYMDDMSDAERVSLCNDFRTAPDVVSNDLLDELPQGIEPVHLKGYLHRRC